MNSGRQRMIRPWCWIALLPAITGTARAGDLIVQFPKDMNVTAAQAQAAPPEAPVPAQIQPGQALLSNLNPQEHYDLQVALQDGATFQGVDMSWENTDPADPSAGDLTDDDRQQIQGILDIPSFFNHSDLLRLSGNHDRAVALVQLLRDQSFVGQNNQEVIWRVELWNLKNENGGWVKLDNKVLRRQRFDSPAAYRRATSKLRWIPALGGISVPAVGTITIALPAECSSQPATRGGPQD